VSRLNVFENQCGLNRQERKHNCRSNEQRNPTTDAQFHAGNGGGGGGVYSPCGKVRTQAYCED